MSNCSTFIRPVLKNQNTRLLIFIRRRGQASDGTSSNSMTQIKVLSIFVCFSSGFEGSDVDEMFSVEYLCSGISAKEGKILSPGFQATCPPPVLGTADNLSIRK
jgi:hypothetical protein